MTLRIVFMGTPDFAVPALAEIIGAGHGVVAAYTQPPRPANRGMAPAKSPIHQFAEQAGIVVRTPESLKGEAEQSAFAALGADAAVVVAYGLILPKAVLNAPRLGCFNLHASALPRWRGAAPIQRAIMAGDSATAAAVMRMEPGLDTGPVCLLEPVAIGPDMTARQLHDELARRGAELMVRALSALERGALDCQPQPADGVTYAAKIGKGEARIDFALSAKQVHNLIRGLSPFPGAWFEVGAAGKRERIKVLRSALTKGKGRPGEILDGSLTVACGEGAIRLVELQRAGKTPMAAADLLRGFPLPPGTVLTSNTR
jgi:methionyl-tRNA formyltransferase